jgi:hypothetical protein
MIEGRTATPQGTDPFPRLRGTLVQPEYCITDFPLNQIQDNDTLIVIWA